MHDFIGEWKEWCSRSSLQSGKVLNSPSCQFWDKGASYSKKSLGELQISFEQRDNKEQWIADIVGVERLCTMEQ